MTHGLSRRPTFLQDKDRDRFSDFLFDMSRLWEIQIYAYGLTDGPDRLLLQTVGRMKAGVGGGEKDGSQGTEDCRDVGEELRADMTTSAGNDGYSQGLT